MNQRNPAPDRAAESRHTSPPIIIKPYCNSELAGMYGVCPRTFGKWLQCFQSEIGERIGRFYSSRQVQIIFQHLGTPYGVWEE